MEWIGAMLFMDSIALILLAWAIVDMRRDQVKQLEREREFLEAVASGAMAGDNLYLSRKSSAVLKEFDLAHPGVRGEE